MDFRLLSTIRPSRTTLSFHHNQNPLSEVLFVCLQVRALMRDVQDPVRLAGNLALEASRVLKHARAYLLELQLAECQLKDDYRMSGPDIFKYRSMWVESVEELNRLEAMFQRRDQVNNNTCNR